MAAICISANKISKINFIISSFFLSRSSANSGRSETGMKTLAELLAVFCHFFAIFPARLVGVRSDNDLRKTKELAIATARWQPFDRLNFDYSKGLQT